FRCHLGCFLPERGRRDTPGVGALPAFAASLAGLFRRELVRSPPRVGRMAAFAASLAGLFRRELVGGPFGVGRLPALAGDLPLLLRVHTCKTAFTLLRHDCDPFWSVQASRSCDMSPPTRSGSSGDYREIRQTPCRPDGKDRRAERIPLRAPARAPLPGRGEKGRVGIGSALHS